MYYLNILDHRNKTGYFVRWSWIASRECIIRILDDIHHNVIHCIRFIDKLWLRMMMMHVCWLLSSYIMHALVIRWRGYECCCAYCRIGLIALCHWHGCCCWRCGSGIRMPLIIMLMMINFSGVRWCRWLSVIGYNDFAIVHHAATIDALIEAIDHFFDAFQFGWWCLWWFDCIACLMYWRHGYGPRHWWRCGRWSSMLFWAAAQAAWSATAWIWWCDRIECWAQARWQIVRSETMIGPSGANRARAIVFQCMQWRNGRMARIMAE